MHPHIGMFQDTVMITDDTLYLAFHYRIKGEYLEFYKWRTNGKQVFVENTGDAAICLITPKETIELLVGEQKMVRG